jgi:AraC-like DNA-binding protein
MNKAKTLISSDRQIQTIVECCGYTSHSYFNKHFKEEFSLSPKTLRAKLKESINESTKHL